MIICSHCNQPYPEDQTPFRCLICGGVFDLTRSPAFLLDEMETALPGIWRYRHTFRLPTNAPVISL
ncbi:MAG: hypothetical protein ACK2T5_09780, partial [Anaerolineales bacterium]